MCPGPKSRMFMWSAPLYFAPCDLAPNTHCICVKAPKYQILRKTQQKLQIYPLIWLSLVTAPIPLTSSHLSLSLSLSTLSLSFSFSLTSVMAAENDQTEEVVDGEGEDGGHGVGGRGVILETARERGFNNKHGTWSGDPRADGAWGFGLMHRCSPLSRLRNIFTQINVLIKIVLLFSCNLWRESILDFCSFSLSFNWNEISLDSWTAVWVFL